MNTTKPMTSSNLFKNIMNTVKASPRRAFWLALAVVCLSAVVVIPLTRTRAAGPAPHAPVAATPQTGSVPQAPSLLNRTATARASFAPLPFTLGTCDTAGPIEVEASGVGPGPTAYATLKAAFDAINAGTHTLGITVEVCGDTTEAASAVLNASGTGSASYAQVIIRPAGGVARTISGSIAGPLIDLNGADNVFISGLNTGGDSLTISNTNTGNTAATIRLINDSTSNTITNTTINGSSTGTAMPTGAATAPTAATILISGTTGTTGNDNNSITNNNIGPAGANLPVAAISSAGQGTGAQANDAITIAGNNIFDFYGASGANGVAVTNSSAFNISTNRFYETASRSGLGSGSYWEAIIVSTSSGGGHTVNSNIIGFASNTGTGLFTNSGGRFVGVDLSAVAASPVSNVQGNTINGINWTTASGAATLGASAWNGIIVKAGSVNVGTTSGNTIGATTGTGTASANLFITTTGTGSGIGPIYVSSANICTVSNNNIGAIGTGGTAAIGYAFTGIAVAGAGSHNISLNSVGNDTAGGIQLGIVGTSTAVSTAVGITSSATGAETIGSSGNANTVQNISLNAVATNTFTGISNTGIGTTLNINFNVIKGINFGATSATHASTFTGISNSAAVTTAININSNNLGTAATGLVTYSLTATAASGTLTGISCSSIAAAAPLSISNNDFRGISYTFAGSGSHTYITYAHSSSVADNINSNTFTNLNVNTTASVTFIIASGSRTATGSASVSSNSVVTGFNKGGAGGTVTFLNGGGSSSVVGSTSLYNLNNCSNVTLTGATGFVGFSAQDGNTGVNGPAMTVTNNTFNNISGTTSASITGISLNFAGTGSNVSNNTVTNISMAPAATSFNLTGISIGSSNIGATQTYSGNTIAGLSSTGTGGQVIGVLGGATTLTTLNINNNTISGISTTSTAGVVVAGIFNQNTGTTTNIFKNKIYDVVCSPGTVIGINSTAAAAANTINIYNNIIGRLYATGSAFFQAARGILVQSTLAATFNLYFNTVYLDGTTPTQTYCLYIGGATNNVPNVNPIDNIFVNNVTSNNGAALPQAAYFRLGVTNATNLASTTNNNLLYAGTPGVDHLIYVDGAVGALTNPQQTLANYKTFVSPRESASVSELPPFLNIVTGSLANYLHINPAIATQVESGGIPIGGITDDFDGDIRNASTPDIGADEFAGTPAASMAYSSSTTEQITGNAFAGASNQSIIRVKVTTTGSLSPLSLTSLTLNANGTTAITDINASTAKVYYTGPSATFSTGTLFGATTPTIADFNVTGTQVLSQGDNYFWLAYDVIPGVTTGNLIDGECNSITVVTPKIPTVTAPVGNKSILGLLTGSYNVGAAQVSPNYATITSALADLTSRGVNGPVTFVLTDSTYPTETFPLTVGSISGASVSNTVTIKLGTGVTAAITGSSSGCLVNLQGADWVTLNGSNGGGVPLGTSRDLSITNTNTGTSSAVVCLQTNVADGATNNTVKNLNVIGSGNTQTLFGVFSGSTTISTASTGTGNNANTIQNNNISKTQFGIFSQGLNAGTKNTGNVITQNLINTVAPNNVSKGGIITGFENNLQITRNVVSEMAQGSSPDVFGISLGIQAISTSTFTGNEVTNATVSRNNVGNVRNTGTFSACGICIAPATSGTNLIANNMISGVSANGTSGDFSVGLLAGGGTGSTTQIYNNSISMTGTQTGGSDRSMGLMIAGGDPIMDVRNNAILNTQNNGTGANYAIVDGSSTFVNLTSNYNDLFTTTGALYFVGGTASTSAPTGQVTLANWTTATGRDTPNSISLTPNFTSLTDLHSSGAPLFNAGTTIAAVPDDFDGDTRPQGAAYDIGADEQLLAPGTLQFSSPTYSGGEGSTLVATVNRVSGSAGTVGVTYTLADGSGAVGGAACGAGIDYVNPGPQVLSFGDTVTSQPINVTLCTDAVSDPSETFALTLSAPTGGAGLGSPTIAIATITDVPPPFNGTYTVGTGGNYPSLTNTGGIFEAINLSGATGAVTINIISDLTGELGTNPLNAVAGGFAVTIKPSGAPRSITGSISANALIRTNGSSNVTIDGSTSGGTDRSLTITNTSVTTPSVVRFGSIGTTPVTNDTLKNCIIVNGVNTSGAVFVMDTGGATSGYFNDINLQNNDVRKAIYGVFAFGVSLAGNGSGLSITQNKLDNTGANAIRDVGIYVQGVDGATVSNNAVGNLNSADAESDTGIWLATGTVNSTVSGNTVTAIGYSGTSTFSTWGIRDSGGAAASGNSISGNTVSNISGNGSSAVLGIDDSSGGTIIQRNNVSGIMNTSTSTYGAYGINITAGNNVVVRNNFISNVNHDMSGGLAFDPLYAPTGIRIAAGTGHQIYHNSVNLYGLQPGTANSALLSAALSIVSTGSTGLDIRNNIFANNITGGTTQIAHVSVYLPSGGTSAMNLTLNNNAYYYGTDSARQGTGQAGTTAGTNFYTSVGALAAYSSTLSPAGTNDNGSFNFTAAVPFASNSDLHVPATAGLILGTGAALGTVTVDFDNDPRPATAPDMGADELVQASNAGVIPSGTFYNASFGSGETLSGDVTITNTLTLNGVVNASTFTLTIGCGATVVGASPTNYVIGNVKKDFCIAGSFMFPVGTPANGSARSAIAAEFTPMAATINSGTFPSSLTVKVTDTWMPGTSTLSSLSRHWDVTETGDLNADMTFQYLDEDVYGNEAGYLVVKSENGMTSSPPGSSVNAAANTFTAVNISQFSKWGAGLIPTAAGASIGGRVLDANGHGIANAQVVITGGDLTAPMTIQTGPFGYYNFTGLAVSRLYVVSVKSGRHTFAEPTRAIDLSSDVTNADFVADPQP